MASPDRSAEAAARPGAFDPRYLVVFGACLTQFMVIGLLFAAGLFFKVFEAEFGWPRTILSACLSLAFLVMGVLAVVGGRLNDRYGPRLVLAVTGVVFGVGFALISQVSEPWQLFALFGVFFGLGLSTHDVVTLSTVARWFEKRRGVMTGVVKVGTAAGQVVIPPLTALMIAGLGWRTAVIALGIAAAVLLVIAALAMKAPPRAGPTGAPPQQDGAAFAWARRTRVFWTLCAIQFLFFPALITIPLHIVVHGTDLGMTATVAAGLLSVSGAASVAGRLTIGALSDRIRGRWAYILCFAPLIVSLLGMLMVTDPRWLFAVIAVYGFGHGGFFTVVSPTVAEYFGMKAHGAIFGAVLFFGTIGGAVGPILAGWVFDTTGSYAVAFSALAGMAALGMALAISLPRPGRVA